MRLNKPHFGLSRPGPPCSLGPGLLVMQAGCQYAYLGAEEPRRHSMEYKQLASRRKQVLI